jgi:hypothetical protein
MTLLRRDCSDEILVAEYFKTKLDLIAERFNKKIRIGKTPDFIVKNADGLSFFCEVKSIKTDMWLDNLFKKNRSIELLGGIRENDKGEPTDPAYNRVAAKIHEAFTQFKSVNSSHEQPNVLFFINHDQNSGCQDLDAVLTGSIECNDGTKFMAFEKYSEGRIKNEKLFIDLCLWWDIWKSEESIKKFVNASCEKHKLSLWTIFNIDPANISY